MNVLMASIILSPFIIVTGAIQIQIPVNSEPWARERECIYSGTCPSRHRFTQNMAGEWNSSHVVNGRYGCDARGRYCDDVVKTTLWRITEDELMSEWNIISFEFKVRKFRIITPSYLTLTPT